MSSILNHPKGRTRLEDYIKEWAPGLQAAGGSKDKPSSQPLSSATFIFPKMTRDQIASAVSSLLRPGGRLERWKNLAEKMSAVGLEGSLRFYLQPFSPFSNTSSSNNRGQLTFHTLPSEVGGGRQGVRRWKWKDKKNTKEEMKNLKRKRRNQIFNLSSFATGQNLFSFIFLFFWFFCLLYFLSFVNWSFLYCH